MDDRTDRRRWVAPSLLIAGMLMLLFSLAAARWSSNLQNWTMTDAQALSDASGRFHRLTFEAADNPTSAVRDDLLNAQEEFQALEQKRVGAIQRAESMVRIARWAGVSLILAGLIVRWQFHQGR